MSYIGKDVKSVSTANITVDSMTGDGSANTLALSLTMVDSIYDVAVYIDGLAQIKGVDYTLSNTTITFATPPSVDQKVVAISTGDALKDNVIDNSFTVDSIKDNSITDAKVVGLDASKLTGALPAVDGSAITGIDGTIAIIQQSYKPTYNADVGEGAIWLNTSTGQFYVCTNGTPGNNTWVNAGTGTGLIEYVPWSYTGTLSAHTFGGYIAHYGTDMIQKWNFASNSGASHKGSIEGPGGRGTDGPIGVSGATHGYVCGGHSADTGGYVSNISKVAHATESESSVNTGANLSNSRSNTDGIGSEIAGYVFNAYPYTSGHLLVVPRRPVRTLAELQEEESESLWKMVTDSTVILQKVFSPEGMNIGLNQGQAAGAGIPNHIHVHVVPRWGGDTNFTTVTANTRVIPESLFDTWTRISEAWSKSHDMN